MNPSSRDASRMALLRRSFVSTAGIARKEPAVSAGSDESLSAFWNRHHCSVILSIIRINYLADGT